jgi:hypothetical protein
MLILLSCRCECARPDRGRHQNLSMLSLRRETRATTAGRQPATTTARDLATRTLTSKPVTAPRDLQLVGLAVEGPLEPADLPAHFDDLGLLGRLLRWAGQCSLPAFEQPLLPPLPPRGGEADRSTARRPREALREVAALDCYSHSELPD